MCKNMRINTTGNKEWRTDLYERTADTFDESSKSGAVDAACIHANQDVDAKQEAIEYLASQLPPHELQRVADILSTDEMNVSVDIETEVSTP